MRKDETAKPSSIREPSGRRGGWGGLLAALAIASGTLSAIGLSIPAIREAGIEGYDLLVQVFAVVAVSASVIAMTGAALRTYAHNHDGRKGLDYAGKVVSLAAVIVASFGGIGALNVVLRDAITFGAIVTLVALALVGGSYLAAKWVKSL